MDPLQYFQPLVRIPLFLSNRASAGRRYAFPLAAFQLDLEVQRLCDAGKGGSEKNILRPGARAFLQCHLAPIY